MRPLQIVVEYLLRGAFVVARAAFVLQALAFGAAAAAAWIATTGERPGWLIQAEISTGALSAVLLITGLLLPIARRWEQPDARAVVEASAVWPVPLGVTMLLLAGLAA